MNIQAGQRQSQTLSPRLQHAVRLLQMSSTDFAALLRDSLGSNPFLETDETDESFTDAAPGADTDSDAAEAVGPTDASLEFNDWDGSEGPAQVDAANDVDAAYDEAADASDRDLWQVEGGSGTRPSEDGEFSALDRVPVQMALNDHLNAQLNLLQLTERQALLARVVVESLDDDGYLRTTVEELLKVVNLQGLAVPPAVGDEMELALAQVQALEPAGVAARSVAECLQLQLPVIDCPKMRSLAGRIVSGHLTALAARDINGMARKLDATPADIEAVCDRIRRLDPRPGHSFGATLAPYVVPDVIVRKQRGQYVVQLNPAVVPRLRLNQTYANLYAQHRGAHSTELGAHLQEARWTLRNVDQRFSTILDVAQAIVRRQKNFLDCGTMAMKPLGLKEIADEVGVHESTVSRVTNNKFIATPFGVFELKYFFSRAMISANGSACSGTAIRSLVQDIIEAESPAAPLSDAEITRQLAVQGLIVARRTVTKYRQMLKIDAVDRRRRLG